MNLEYIRNILHHRGNKDSKSWIIRNSSQWLGLNPLENQYFDQAIAFGGDIDFTILISGYKHLILYNYVDWFPSFVDQCPDKFQSARFLYWDLQF
jgi:hypothetical protein